MHGWTPVIGEWTGYKTMIGVYNTGTWYLDYNGDGKYNSGDKNYAFGSSGWTPVIGDWDDTGYDKVGVYRNGAWYLDYDGSGTWNAGDKNYAFGTTGWTPVIGKWI